MPDDYERPEVGRDYRSSVNPGRRSFLGRLLAAGAFGLIVADGKLHAAKKKRKNVRPLSRKGNASELPRVQSVGADSIRVGGKRYVLSDSAEVIVNGKEASLSEVKVGMQAMMTGGVLKTGESSKDTVYKATRIVARTDNQLQKKAKEANKKAAEAARKANQRKNGKR